MQTKTIGSFASLCVVCDLCSYRYIGRFWLTGATSMLTDSEGQKPYSCRVLYPHRVSLNFSLATEILTDFSAPSDEGAVERAARLRERKDKFLLI